MYKWSQRRVADSQAFLARRHGPASSGRPAADALGIRDCVVQEPTLSRRCTAGCLGDDAGGLGGGHRIGIWSHPAVSVGACYGTATADAACSMRAATAAGCDT